MDAAEYGIFLNGSYGVGKSSVLDHLGDRFAAEGRAFSLLDVDWFHRSWPPAADDPRNVLTEAENMSAVWANYARTGARTPLVAGVIASDADRQRYEAVFGRRLRVVLLTASPAVAERRLRGRYDADRASTLDWHLARHEELAACLAAGQWNDVTVPTDDLRPAEVAAIIVARVAADLSGAIAETPPAMPRS
jgi:thymidylate kinase